MSGCLPHHVFLTQGRKDRLSPPSPRNLFGCDQSSVAAHRSQLTGQLTGQIGSFTATRSPAGNWQPQSAQSTVGVWVLQSTVDLSGAWDKLGDSRPPREGSVL